MRQAFLGLGGNIGDTLGYLREAVLALEAESPDGAVEVIAVSSVYETEPIGGPEQDVFLNIVAEIKTSLEPYELLEFCLGLEQATGRVRRVRWGPRTLDVDVLWMEGVVMNEEDLTIPHPRMTLRRFVMVPLGEIAPEFLAGWEDPEDGDIKKAGDLFPEGAEAHLRVGLSWKARDCLKLDCQTDGARAKC